MTVIFSNYFWPLFLMEMRLILITIFLLVSLLSSFKHMLFASDTFKIYEDTLFMKNLGQEILIFNAFALNMAFILLPFLLFIHLDSSIFRSRFMNIKNMMRGFKTYTSTWDKKIHASKKRIFWENEGNFLSFLHTKFISL